MNTSPDIGELAKALSAFQGTVQTVKKDSANPHFKSRFASLESFITTAAPHLAAHGLAVSQTVSWDGSTDLLVTMLTHTSGQWIVDGQRLSLAKDDPQGMASATTYARRINYLAILGLAPSDDDDGNAATAAVAKRTTKATPVARPKPEVEQRPVVSVDELRSAAKAAGYATAEALFVDIHKVTGEAISSLDELSFEGCEQFLTHLSKTPA